MDVLMKLPGVRRLNARIQELQAAASQAQSSLSAAEERAAALGRDAAVAEERAAGLERELAAARAEATAARGDLLAVAADSSNLLRTHMPLIQAQLTAATAGTAQGFRDIRDRMSAAAGGGSSVGRDRYLDLLESALTGMLYADESEAPWAKGVFDPSRRAIGRDWPRTAQTMIGTARMANLRHLVERAIREDIPGDFIETGVWRGGACIYAKGIFVAHGQPDRRVFVADSFRGLPPPDAETYPADAGDEHHTVEELAISRADVEENFRRYGLLDESVVFLEGWFKDTLPSAPIERLSVLRLDGDMYESTMDALNALYHKVSPGGFVIVDDYVLPACAKAIHDFRDSNGITETMEQVDGAAVWWQVKA